VEYAAGHRAAFWVHFQDGSWRSFGSPDLQDMTKLWQSVEAARQGAGGRQRLALGIEGAVPQVACIEAMHRYGEIKTFPPERIRTQEQVGEPLIWVEGLAETLEKAYRENRLP